MNSTRSSRSTSNGPIRSVGETSLNPKAAGWCGVLAGVGLLVEAALWTASGWTPERFADPAAAMTFLAEEGVLLRWAVAFGFANLALLVVFVAGLADHLRAGSPTLATGTLWFGMIGIATHLLVPFTHWYGVPAFLEAAATDPQAAESAWVALITVGHEAAGGAGSLFMGLSMLTAGWAILARRSLPVLLGWLALITGAATMLTVLAPDTPLSAVAGAAFVPALTLAVVFRIWGGIALIRTDPAPTDAHASQRREHRPAG